LSDAVAGSGAITNAQHKNMLTKPTLPQRDLIELNLRRLIGERASQITSAL
jgi:hypothetical protein